MSEEITPNEETESIQDSTPNEANVPFESRIDFTGLLK